MLASFCREKKICEVELEVKTNLGLLKNSVDSYWHPGLQVISTKFQWISGVKGLEDSELLFKLKKLFVFFLFAFIFIGAMSIVLWNAGLLGGLRRYGEFGIRLAMGETKPKIYKSLILGI